MNMWQLRVVKMWLPTVHLFSISWMADLPILIYSMKLPLPLLNVACSLKNE